MPSLAHMTAALPAAAQNGSGNFLVSPNLGLMIWTLIAFGVTMYVLSKFAFPRITEALDRRRHRHRLHLRQGDRVGRPPAGDEG